MSRETKLEARWVKLLWKHNSTGPALVELIEGHEERIAELEAALREARIALVDAKETIHVSVCSGSHVQIYACGDADAGIAAIDAVLEDDHEPK